MTFRLFGLPEETRLAIEEASGGTITTETARILVEASVREAEAITNATLNNLTREVQGIIGPRGTLTRIQAGGINITRGEGLSVYADGVNKTTITPRGELIIGSDITQPATTTEVFFVEDAIYNGEEFGAGDFLVGDNSESNVKFDASEGQLQFRSGSTVKAYMDTDGSLKAGEGVVTLNDDGIEVLVTPDLNDLSAYKFVNNAGEIIGALYGFYDPDTSTGTTLLQGGNMDIPDSTGSLIISGRGTDVAQVQIAASTSEDAGGEDSILILLHSHTTAQKAITLNYYDNDVDTIIKDDAGAEAIKVDAAAHTVSIYGQAPAWMLIEDKNLGADAASFDFQSIPATFKHLKIEFVARSDRAAVTSDGAKIRFNNDTGNNYIGMLQYDGQTNKVEQATAAGPMIFTHISAASSPANYFCNAEVTIFNYADTNHNHTWQSRGMQIETNSAGKYWIYDSMGMYLSTTAISRVTITPAVGSNFKQFSRATLYGLK
jgi:hypothetical protein